MINFLITAEEVQAMIQPWLTLIAAVLTTIITLVFSIWKLGKMFKDGKETFETKVDAKAKELERQVMQERLDKLELLVKDTANSLRDQVSLNARKVQRYYGKHKNKESQKSTKDE